MRWSKKVGANYEELYDLCKTKSSRKRYVDKAAAKAIKYKKKYVSVAKVIGCPWEFIAAIHMRESNADFRGVLHNGQKIIGTGRKTTLVPKGQGPFDTWEEAAIHSLKRMKIHKITDWSNGRMCYQLERYNGWGYQRKGRSKRSPYLWAGSNLQKAGKYVADGKYSSRTWDKQLGAVTVLKKIRQLDKPTKEVVKESRRLTLFTRIQRFIEWSGVTSFFTMATLETGLDILTDARTIAIVSVAISVYILILLNKYMTIREYKEGRYVPSAQYDEEIEGAEYE